MGFWDWFPPMTPIMRGILTGECELAKIVFGKDSDTARKICEGTAIGTETVVTWNKIIVTLGLAAVSIKELYSAIEKVTGQKLSDSDKAAIKKAWEEEKEKIVPDLEPPEPRPCLAGSCIYDINHLDKLYTLRDFLPPILVTHYYKLSALLHKIKII